MHYQRITNDFIKRIKENNYLDDYKTVVEKMNHSNAIYKGKTIPFLYQPIFHTEEDIKNYQKIINTLTAIVNKVTDEYIRSSDFRKKFGFSPLLEELILVDQGYDVNVPIGRFDIFYQDLNHFKFCELNTDGSSAMNEDNTLGNILLESKILKDLNVEFKSMELFSSWVKESIAIYNQRHDKKPNVAIVDFIESGTLIEFEEFKKAYEAQGYNCIIADPRHLTYKDGILYYEDYPIDLIYRRIVTKELIERSDEIKDLIEAYKDKAVCVVGSIKSQIMHTKLIFKILHEEDTLALLSKEEQAFIHNHIPYTAELNEQTLPDVLKNKDDYIIKPFDLYGSHGVYAGRDYSTCDWGTLLKNNLNSYLYQEFVTPYTRPFVEVEKDEFIVSDFRHIIGLFSYHNQLAGLYTRVGKENIISGLHSYYTVANIIATNK